MANNTPTSTSSSRLTQFIVLVASVGVLALVYLLRRRPEAAPLAPNEIPVNPVSVDAVQSTGGTVPQPTKPPTPVKRWQELAAIALTFGYGIVLVVLHNIDPNLSTILIGLTLVIVIGIGIWKRYLIPIHLTRILFNVLAVPVRFYQSGQLEPIATEKGDRASVAVSAVMLGVLSLALLLLPSLPLVSLFLLLIVIGIGTFGWLSLLDVFILERRFLASLKISNVLDAVALPRAAWWLVVAELFVIVMTTAFTTRSFYESPPNWQLSGSEVEWLTSTIYAAHTGLQEYGRIPRWQPYIAHGEPTIENPFNFTFNPFAGMPSLILGGVTGLRLSVIISYFVAGLGGWFLGRILGFGSLGRILLAMILMGKGNIHTMLNSSYYQLALSQIYMPWVIGGVIAIARFPKQRWPLVLTALAMTLQLFNGNLWYVLPTAVGAVCTAVACAIATGEQRLNWPLMRRYVLTGIVTLGLSAIIAIPIVLQFNRIGKHTEEVAAGWVAPLRDVIPLFFDPSRERRVTFFEPAFGRTMVHIVTDVDEFYYTFIIPGWYVLLIVVALPLYRPISRRDRLIGIVALLLFGLATLWGSGGRQPILLLYQLFPPLRQWRFVPRALAVASFWLAVLVVMRADQVWKYIRLADWAALLKIKTPKWLIQGIPIALSLFMVVTTAFAGSEVNDQWYQYTNIMRESDSDRTKCTTWLRQQFPDEPLAVWQQNYTDMTTFLNNRVRSWNITADFEMLPQDPTIGLDWLDLNAEPPTFGEFTDKDQRGWGRDNGYQIIRESPLMQDGIPCLSRRTGPVLPYAYSIPLVYLESMKRPDYLERVNLSAFLPIRLVERREDQIALVITRERLTPTVVGIQESAYPGWRVEVDGQPAKIESVGRQVGVLIPAGKNPVQIYFVYEPIQPIIGGIITLVTALLCILYLGVPTWLTRVSRLLGSVIKRRRAL